MKGEKIQVSTCFVRRILGALSSDEVGAIYERFPINRGIILNLTNLQLGAAYKANTRQCFTEL